MICLARTRVMKNKCLAFRRPNVKFKTQVHFIDSLNISLFLQLIGLNLDIFLMKCYFFSFLNILYVYGDENLCFTFILVMSDRQH